MRWNAFCRSQKKPIGFVMVAVRGAAAHCFTDFGNEFLVRDLAGEVPKTRVVDTIDARPDGTVLVRLADAKGHLPFGNQ